MSRKRRKGYGCGHGWSYSEWRRDESGAGERHHEQRHYAGWTGGPWGAAWAGPGFGGRNFRILSGLRRDPWHGKVSGVCAGIAGYYGINVKIPRILLIVGLFINPLLTIGGYVLATFLLRPLPDPAEFGGSSESNAGTSAAEKKSAEEALPPELRFAALKDKFRELEGRTGEIETLVTSPEFRLRRDFRKMGEA